MRFRSVSQHCRQHLLCQFHGLCNVAYCLQVRQEICAQDWVISKLFHVVLFLWEICSIILRCAAFVHVSRSSDGSTAETIICGMQYHMGWLAGRLVKPGTGKWSNVI